MVNLSRRITGGRSVAVLALTAVLSLGTLGAAVPANAAGPVASGFGMVIADIPARIAGTVTALSPTGELVPLAEVVVSVSSGPDYDWTKTDSAGNYALTGLAAGDYEIQFMDYSSTRANLQADTWQEVTIGDAGAVLLDVTMAPGSTIAGTLTQNVGGVVTPAAFIAVSIFSLDGYEVAQWDTDNDGRYAAAALPAGTYKVGFGTYGPTDGLVPEYFNDVYTLAAAKSFVLAEGASITGINAQLSNVRHVDSATPTITGTKKVGYALTANPGTWGPGTVTLTYQWYRAGVAITGATRGTYLLTNTDAGKAISVRVKGAKTGYSSITRASVATAAIAAGLVAPTPTITGTKRVGYTLTANPGAWGPAPVTLAYQWYRSGVAISLATAKTYKLVSADRYDTIKVRVVGTKTGYAGVAKYSASTVKIP